ncbi:MAG: dodecin family protein [Gammaproteobacteria bacterium]|nr:dodecin family protein [Gammaproteobacteria bacterium]MCZ6895860.1 dodecin family protein [Gammaproteobacteria bacterium]
MTDHVYKIIEITGTSTKSMEDAVETALVKAAVSLKNIRWFEVTNIRGDVADGKVKYWQLTIKLGFTLSDNAGD